MLMQIWAFLVGALILGAALGVAVFHLGTRASWRMVQGERDTYRMRFEQAQSESFRLRNTLTEREQRCNTLEAELTNERSAHEAERASLREQLDAASAAHAGAVAARDAANRQLDSANRQAADYRAKLAERDTELNNARTELGGVRAELTSARAELTNMRSEFARGKETLVAVTSSRDHAIKKVEELQHRLDALAKPSAKAEAAAVQGADQPSEPAAGARPAKIEAVRVEAAPVKIEAVRVEAAPAKPLSAEAKNSAATATALAEIAAIAAAPRKPPNIAEARIAAVAKMDSTELAKAIQAAGSGRAPAGLKSSRGSADDLKEIGGVGPTMEKWLNNHGIFHFWQIAQWGPDELAWVVNQIPSFGSRVYRENWVQQATQLARGEMTEAKQKYLRGEQS